MVDVAMVELVGQHPLEAVVSARVIGHAPVISSHLGRGYVLPRGVQPCARRESRGNDVGVGVHRRLLEVADEAVQQLRPQEVEAAQERRKGDLCAICTAARVAGPASKKCMHTIRCMRSFSASSSSVTR